MFGEWREVSTYKGARWAMRSEGEAGLGRAGKAELRVRVLSCGFGQVEGWAGDLGTGRGLLGCFSSQRLVKEPPRSKAED